MQIVSSDKPTADDRLKVGDAVCYVPDACHARIKDHRGDYPWVFGRRVQGRGRETEDAVEELSARETAEFLAYAANSPDPRREQRSLVLLRPRVVWPAKVKTVHDDGTVDIDVDQGNGVTLHLAGVAHDPAKKKPHTYHRGGR